jgi:tellurite resistance protein TerC
METIGTWWMWVAFAAVVLVMLAIDLFVVGGGKQHKVSFKEAATWSLVWVPSRWPLPAALWWYLDGAMGRELWPTKSTRIRHRLPDRKIAGGGQRLRLADAVRLLRRAAGTAEARAGVGVLGAIVMRTVMIFAGVWLIAKFHWILYVFGAFLLITGIKMWWFADEPSRISPTTR